VYSSDHEVNLKILLGLAIQREELTLEGRNDLLGEVEQDVVRHVLYDNFLQAQILSQELELSPQWMESFEDLMQVLEAEGALERELEAPLDRGDGGRVVRVRMARPKLSTPRVAKQGLATRCSPPPCGLRLPGAGPRSYFPPRVERFGAWCWHPLRRELSRRSCERVVNSQGITFVSRLVARQRRRRCLAAYRVRRDFAARSLGGSASRRWSAPSRPPS
jgi:glutamate dehydrogenase